MAAFETLNNDQTGIGPKECVRSKGTMQQPTVSYLERTESTQQFHQDFPCCQTKTAMIHAAILFSIHHDSKSFIGDFTPQCRQTLLISMKGKLSFELASKTSVRKLWSIYHSSQITLEGKIILKKKSINFFANSTANCYTGVAEGYWEYSSMQVHQSDVFVRLPREQDLPCPV